MAGYLDLSQEFRAGGSMVSGLLAISGIGTSETCRLHWAMSAFRVTRKTFARSSQLDPHQTLGPHRVGARIRIRGTNGRLSVGSFPPKARALHRTACQSLSNPRTSIA